MSITITETAATIQARIDHNASENVRRAVEQLDDAYVSSMCGGLSMSKDRAKLDILAAGGVATFRRTVLLHADTRLPVANTPGVESVRSVMAKYGMRWVINYSNGDAPTWLPFEPKRESTLGNKGYAEGEEVVVAPADAEIASSNPNARGFSGLSSCYTRVFRSDVPRGQQDQWTRIANGDCKAEYLASFGQ